MFLLVWCWLAGVGVEYARHWFFPSSGWYPWTVVAMAAWMAEVDYHENLFNHRSAREGSLPPYYQSWLDVLYWLRALGFVAFAIGTAFVVGFAAYHVWHGSVMTPAMGRVLLEASLAPLASLVVTLFLAGLPRKAAAEAPAKAGASALERVAIAGMAVFALWLLPHLWHQLASTFSIPITTTALLPEDLEFSGHLLFVLTVFFYFVNSTWWSGEPMEKARLTSIVDLQKRGCAQGVKEQLDRWATRLLRKSLPCDPGTEKPEERAAREMRAAVGKSLWRDIRGYIVIYNLLMALGLWFASADLHWQFPFLFPVIPWGDGQITAWWWLPLVTAFADWVEDAFHLAYLRKYVRAVTVAPDGSVSGEAPVGWWPNASLFATAVKFAGLLIGMPLTVGAIIAGGWRLLAGEQWGGWRGSLALLGAGVVFVMVLLQLLVRIRPQRAKAPTPPKPTA